MISKNSQNQIAGLSTLLGFAVLVSYYITFPDESYINSRLWLNTSKPNIILILILQGLAVLGLVTFLSWICGMWGKPLKEGPLSYNDGLITKLLIFFFLFPLLFWAPLTQRAIDDKSLLCVIGSCATIYITALATAGLLAGSFVNTTTPTPALLGIIMFTVISILVDALGWNSQLIFNHIAS